MSDYISKSALLERFRKDNRYSRHGFVSENYIDCLIKEFPTVDEKEIIRKPFERVVERLNEEMPISWEHDYRGGKKDGIMEAIKILKEECGINE
jgi:hypothetical protein